MLYVLFHCFGKSSIEYCSETLSYKITISYIFLSMKFTDVLKAKGVIAMKREYSIYQIVVHENWHTTYLLFG